MDIGVMKQKLLQWTKKYKYAALILAVGLVLMLLPGKSEKSQSDPATTDQTVETQIPVNQQLAEILASIEGVGRVEVMLTVASGPQTVYQNDKTESSGEKDHSLRQETVTVTDSDRNEMGLIIQIIPEKYQGAVVVCQGAGSPSVRLAVLEAVANATGLSTDRISVLKMK